MRSVVIIGLCVCVVLIGSGLAVPTGHAQDPIATETDVLDGLRAPVEVLMNDYGVPHVYASNSYDLFFMQGYLMASERFWQMDLARRTADGRLSEIIGRAGLGSDEQFRTLGLHQAAQADLAQSSPQSEELMQAFTAGVNAFIDGKTPVDVAVEYEMLAAVGVEIVPEPWEIVDSFLISKVSALGLSENLTIEIARAQGADEFGDLLVDLFLPAYPYDIHPVTLEPGAIDATGEVQTPEVSRTDLEAMDAESLRHAYDIVASGVSTMLNQGSNSWVISGNLTESGSPILASDPHISINQPSVWYEMGLHCETISIECPYKVSGFASVGLPGIYIGHNERIAWGVTNTGADVQDLYILTLNPDNPLQYRYNDEWRDFEIREETIRVRGEGDQLLTVLESVWGPVVLDNGDGTVMALRWAAFDPASPIEGQLGIMRAGNWDDFLASTQMVTSPIFNLTYADVDGNIGFITPGNIPIRAEGHDGKTPVDGSTDAFAWQGYIPFDELPMLFNPDAGYIINANNRVVNQDYPYPLIDVYSYGWRALRLEQLFQQDTDGVYTMEEMQLWQTDNYNLKADFMMPVIQDIKIDDPIVRQAVQLLTEWDRVNDGDSGGAAFMAIFWTEFIRAAIGDDIGLAPSGGGDLEWRVVQILITAPNFPLWDDTNTDGVTETLDDILILALRNAWVNATELLGDDPAAWRWDALHRATFRPQIFNVAGINAADFSDMVRSVGVGGGDAVVNANSWTVNNPYRVTSIPTHRQITDLSNFDGTLRVMPMGQSGHPDSPHYADQLELWAEEQYRTAVFSREAVEAQAVSRMLFVPEAE